MIRQSLAIVLLFISIGLPFAHSQNLEALHNLPSASSVNATDLFYDVQIPGLGGVKVTAAQIKTFINGASGAASITRAQIPTTHFGGMTEIVLVGYRTANDLGHGAIYSTVNASCTSGLMYIKDADNQCWNMVVQSIGTSNISLNELGTCNPGWFGGYGDGNSFGSAEQITSGDISANPQWKGTYTAGQSWDYVAIQEAIYCAWATSSTPGTINWNSTAGGLNSTLRFPSSGTWEINATLFSVMDGFTIEMPSRRGGAGPRLFWNGASAGTLWKFDSAAYGEIRNLSVDCSGTAINFSPASGATPPEIPCLVFDHDGSTPGGLFTQQVTITNLEVNVGRFGEGVSFNPVAVGGQADTITFINPIFIGDGYTSYYAVELNGNNALQYTFVGGDCQGFPANCIKNNGGQFLTLGMHTENQNNGSNSLAPVLNQENTAGADFHSIGGVSTDNSSVIMSGRSEATILSRGEQAGFNDIYSSITTGSDTFGWFSSFTGYNNGMMITGGTLNRRFMVVDNGGACPQWCAITGGSGTSTVQDSNASYTTNQWVNFTLWLRFGSNGFYNRCTITANTATTITYSGCSNLSSQSLYQIGGSSGGSTPSWNSATLASRYNSDGTNQNANAGINTYAGTNCIGTAGVGTLSVGTWLVLPYADRITVTSNNWAWPLYAKVTANSGSACPGQSNSPSATIDRNAGASIDYSVTAIPVYFGTPIVDNAISWLGIPVDAVYGAKNVHGMVAANGWLGGSMDRVAITNFTTASGDFQVDPNISPSVVSNNRPALSLFNGATGTYECQFGQTNGTFDITGCARSTNLITITATGSVTFNAVTAPVTQFGQQLHFIITPGSGCGGSCTITFGTNFSAKSPIQMSVFYNATIDFASEAGTWNEVSRNTYSVAAAQFLYSAAGTALPSCVTANKGATGIVSDATAPTYNSTYTSGGTVVAPVMCNGTNWVTY